MHSDARAAVGELIDRHFDTVYEYVAFRLAPHLECAADIAQEVFSAAVREPPPPTAARAWLLKVARNKVADHYRRRARRQHEPLDPERVGPDLRLGGDEQARRDRAACVAAVMRELPRAQADLLEDKYLRGLSVRQIAEERGATAKAIESALSRAREAFRQATSAEELKAES